MKRSRSGTTYPWLGAAMAAWGLGAGWATPLELPLELWQTGAATGEAELPGFRQLVDAIAVSQNPASCDGARFAILSNANAGVGCVMHRIASEMAWAWEQGRIAVWNPAETAWTDDPWCKEGGDGNGWGCLFKPLSRCALPEGVASPRVVSAGIPVASSSPEFYVWSRTGPFSGLVPPKAAAILQTVPNVRNETMHNTWIASALALAMRPNARTMAALDQRRHLCPKAADLDYAVHVYGEYYVLPGRW